MKAVQIPRRFVRDEWGGTETVVLQTSKRLPENGWETEILCPNALSIENQEIIDGVAVHRYPYFYPYLGLKEGARERMDKKGGNMFSFGLLRALQTMPELNLIHLHTGKRIGGIGRYVARKRGIPYVISLHGGVHDVPQSEAATWTEPTQGAWEWGKALGMWVGARNVLTDAAAILCVGKTEEKEMKARHPNSHVLHLPNGVDAARFQSGDGMRFRAAQGIPANAFVVGSIGRIDVQKNQLALVQALPEMLKMRPETHLLIIGPVTNPYYRDRLILEAAKCGVTGRMTLLPGLDASGSDLPDAYHAIDLFALPSVHEPFGIVILEAWAAQRPVIASRVGGIPDFVEHNANGLLFAPDSPDQLLNAFQACATDPVLCSRLAAAGQDTVARNYDWSTITRQLSGIYNSLISP